MLLNPSCLFQLNLGEIITLSLHILLSSYKCKQLFHIIYEKFLGSTLTEEENKMVKEIDHALLYYDLKELLNECSCDIAPKIQISLNYEFVPFAQVEQSYLDIYHQYKLIF